MIRELLLKTFIPVSSITDNLYFPELLKILSQRNIIFKKIKNIMQYSFYTNAWKNYRLLLFVIS